MRIEVGYGLEGTLTDVAADRIIRNLMTPLVSARAITTSGSRPGTTAIIQILEGRQPAAADAEWAAPAKPASGFHVEPAPMPWPERIPRQPLRLRHHRPVHVHRHGHAGGNGWFMYVFLIPFWSMFPLAIFGSFAALVIVSAYAVL